MNEIMGAENVSSYSSSLSLFFEEGERRAWASGVGGTFEHLSI